MLTQERLKEILDYNPLTGEFIWKPHPRLKGSLVGSAAGRVMKRRIPYIQIRVGGEGQFYAHRLAFLYMTGRWPAQYVDHKDGDGLNNRWANLREATYTQNQWNTGVMVANTSGFKGVCFNKRLKKFQAAIRVRGKIRHLGLYPTAEEAAAAYCGASILLHEEFSFATSA
jgi:hypothetical protein